MNREDFLGHSKLVNDEIERALALKKQKVRNKIIGLRMTDSEYFQLEDACKKEGIKPSLFVHHIVQLGVSDLKKRQAINS